MNPQLTEKLDALRSAFAAVQPLEIEDARFHELYTERENLENQMATCADLATASTAKDKLSETSGEFVLLSQRLPNRSGRRQELWMQVSRAFDEVTEPLRAEIDALAGQPVIIAGTECDPPSAATHRDAIAALQVKSATNSTSIRNRRTLGTEMLQACEAAVAALPLIQGERAALVKAAETYEKAVGKL